VHQVDLVHAVERAERTERIVIRCTRETAVAFRRYAAEFRNYEEALLSLLARAGAHRGLLL